MLVALLVGTIEALSVVVAQFRLGGPFWDALGHVGDNFGLLGFLIVGVFVASWGVSALVYGLRRYDRLELEKPA